MYFRQLLSDETARASCLSEDTFVEALTRDIPPMPEQQTAIVAANRRGHLAPP